MWNKKKNGMTFDNHRKRGRPDRDGPLRYTRLYSSLNGRLHGMAGQIPVRPLGSPHHVAGAERCISGHHNQPCPAGHNGCHAFTPVGERGGHGRGGYAGAGDNRTPSAMRSIYGCDVGCGVGCSERWLSTRKADSGLPFTVIRPSEATVTSYTSPDRS